MSTHDADKTNKAPSDRRTMTRDPNSTGGAIVEGRDSDADGNRRTTAGSTHLTTNIDGKWYVCNTRGEPYNDTAYDTETEAVEEAQKHNQISTGAAQSEEEIDRVGDDDKKSASKKADAKK